jgi:TRAP-type C4-dicarboxylate transport system permease small subunit
LPNGARYRYSLEGIVATIVFAVLVCVLLLQVAGRFGYFRPPIWTEELSRWLWIWMAFFGIAEVERTNAHLRVELLPQMLPTTARLAVFSLIDLVYFAITCDLIWIGYQGVLRSWNNTAVSLPVTDAVLYASYPLAALFIAYRIARRLMEHVRDLRRRDA